MTLKLGDIELCKNDTTFVSKLGTLALVSPVHIKCVMTTLRNGAGVTSHLFKNLTKLEQILPPV